MNESSAGSVSDQIPGKCKIKAAGKATQTAPKAKPAILASWPPEFRSLERVHRCLNMVYTFCCARKHFATTFENIKSSVENLLGSDLQILDIARIKFLVPESINFAYIREEELCIDVESSDTSSDVFKVKLPTETNGQQVLLFEFTDGELRRKVERRANDEKFHPRKRLRKELPPLKMPTFTPAAMTRLIEKRNNKFIAAVNEFLTQCEKGVIDPSIALAEQYTPHVPVTNKIEAPTVASMTRPSSERASIASVIEELVCAESYTDQIVHHRILEEKSAVFGHLTQALSQQLINALYNTRNITSFYSHQADAINQLWDGSNVVISTSTSSGKSLIYQIPVLDAMEKDQSVTALYIFPTKALAQDQKRSLLEILSFMDSLSGIVVETFDGDTPMDARQRIRETASVIFTNPDTLHITILPQEDKWRIFLKNLKYVVVDELHVYNGLFGSHVALIMRRLRRICATLGNRRHLQFVSCTATLPNAVDHMKAIFGVDNVTSISADGSPTGRKEIVLWNPPRVDPSDPKAGRVSALQETAKMLILFMERGIRTIIFCKVRRTCDLLLKIVRDRMMREAQATSPDLLEKVMSYRGGYTPQDRRRIERDMFEGRLLGIIATTALELGIDIGSLDAVLMVGFPYSIAAFRQQSGRAGRRNKDSLTMMIAESFPMDQHYVKCPEELFTTCNAEAIVDLGNTIIVEGHLQCAAKEMPIDIEHDTPFFGEKLAQVAAERLVQGNGGFYHCHPKYLPNPASHVSIRDIEDEHYVVIDITNGANIVLEELEPSRAIFTVYEGMPQTWLLCLICLGGVYMHQGRTYIVKELNIDNQCAKVLRANIDWTTRQREFTSVVSCTLVTILTFS